MQSIQQNRYHEIKSAFSPAVSGYLARVKYLGTADEIVTYLRQRSYAWIPSVAIQLDQRRYEWNSAFRAALEERTICEKMLEDRASTQQIIDHLLARGYSRSEIAAFIEGLYGLASGRAKAIVNEHAQGTVAGL